MLAASLRVKTLLLLLAAVVALASAQTSCVQSGQGQYCALETPWCVQRAARSSFCSPCSRAIYEGGGSCQCDPTTSYCSSASGTIGYCLPYTTLGKSCKADADCKTTTYNSYFGTVTEEITYCVNSVCSTCSPTRFASANAGPIVTCAGFDSVKSNTLQRYATSTNRPGTMYTCNSNGTIVMLNSTIDFSFGFPGPDRNAWSPSIGNGVGVSTSTSAAAALATSTSTASTTTTTAVQVQSATTAAGATTGKSSKSSNSLSDARHTTAALVLVAGAVALCL